MIRPLAKATPMRWPRSPRQSPRQPLNPGGSMQRTSTRALVVLALISGAAATSVSWAARPVAPTAAPEANNGQIVAPARLPIGVDQPVTVVVQLRGDPVAVRQGNA